MLLRNSAQPGASTMLTLADFEDESVPRLFNSSLESFAPPDSGNKKLTSQYGVTSESTRTNLKPTKRSGLHLYRDGSECPRESGN